MLYQETIKPESQKDHALAAFPKDKCRISLLEKNLFSMVPKKGNIC